MPPSFINIYIACAALACASILWLSLTGPPPPLATHTYLPAQPESPRLLLGDESYRPFDDETVEARWDALVPAWGGAVLATNVTSGFHFWAVPAMFHQLQCLHAIRSQFVALRNAQSPEVARKFMAEQGSGSRYDNIAYCFDYVRQGVLCHADTTLHPVMQLTPEQKIIDGNALWHQCKDSEVLYQWAEMSGRPHTDPLVRQHPITPNTPFDRLIQD